MTFVGKKGKERWYPKYAPHIILGTDKSILDEMKEEKIYPFDKEYRDEVYRRYNESGTLFFVKRTDTNQYYCEPFFLYNSPHQYKDADYKVSWVENIGLFELSGGFLTTEDAKQYVGKFTQGGCRHCLHGSEEIPTIIVELKFENEKIINQ